MLDKAHKFLPDKARVPWGRCVRHADDQIDVAARKDCACRRSIDTELSVVRAAEGARHTAVPSIASGNLKGVASARLSRSGDMPRNFPTCTYEVYYMERHGFG